MSLLAKRAYLECCECGNLCCPDRCNPVAGEICDNPLPETLTCTLTVSTVKNDPITGLPTTCYSVTGTLFLSPTGDWIGKVEGTCSGWCGGETRVFQYTCMVSCGLNPNGSRSWFIVVEDYSDLDADPNRKCAAPFSNPPVWATFASTCDPIMLTGQTASFFCGDLACIIPMLGIDEFFGDVVFDVLVTEDP